MHGKLYVIHIITNYLHLNSAEYGLQKWFIPSQRMHVLSAWHTLWQSLLTHCKWWNSCIGIRHTSYLIWIWVETQLAPNQEICEFTLGLLSICIEYGLDTTLAKRCNNCLRAVRDVRDVIIVLELDMQLIGNQNSLRTWVRPTEDVNARNTA